MSEAQFEIEVTDDVTLTRDSMVEHAEHGPMHVDSIIISGLGGKRVELKAELSNIGLELTDEELREQWGETIAQDPFALRDAGTSRYENNGITAEDCDVTVDITVEGPSDEAEVVQMHAINQIVKGIQAMRDGVPPEDCDGAQFEIDWEKVHAEDDDDE